MLLNGYYTCYTCYFSQSKHLQMCKGLSKHEKGLSEHKKGLSDLDHSKMYRKLTLPLSKFYDNNTHCKRIVYVHTECALTAIHFEYTFS